MKYPPKTNTLFSRPLLEFIDILQVHQTQIADYDHEPLDLIIDEVVSDLKSIQNAQDLMPSSEAGIWVIKSTFESAQDSIRNRCQNLHHSIIRHRLAETLDTQKPPIEALDRTLEELEHFLQKAVDNLSLLSMPVKIQNTAASTPSRDLWDALAIDF